MKVSSDDLYALRAKQKKLYRTFVPVRAHMLRKDVSFNKAGFDHLYKDGRGHYRNKSDAKNRLELLEYAPLVLAQSKIIKEEIKPESDTWSKKKEVYYTFYHKVGAVQMPVAATVRIVGNGDPHFYGIRPNFNRKRPQKRS